MDERTAQLQQEARQLRAKIVGRRYRHYKGRRYTVVDVVLDATTRGTEIIYCPLDNQGAHDENVRWSRPLSEFFQMLDNNQMRFAEEV